MSLKKLYPTLLVLLLSTAEAMAKIESIQDIESGSQSFAETIINLFSGPWGLIWAAIMLIAAFVESKTLDARWLVVTTVIVGLAPFLISALLKFVYL